MDCCAGEARQFQERFEGCPRYIGQLCRAGRTRHENSDAGPAGDVPRLSSSSPCAWPGQKCNLSMAPMQVELAHLVHCHLPKILSSCLCKMSPTVPISTLGRPASLPFGQMQQGVVNKLVAIRSGQQACLHPSSRASSCAGTSPLCGVLLPCHFNANQKLMPCTKHSTYWACPRLLLWIAHSRTSEGLSRSIPECLAIVQLSKCSPWLRRFRLLL